MPRSAVKDESQSELPIRGAGPSASSPPGEPKSRQPEGVGRGATRRATLAGQLMRVVEGDPEGRRRSRPAAGARAEPPAPDLRSPGPRGRRDRDVVRGCEAPGHQLAADARPVAAGHVDLGGHDRSEGSRSSRQVLPCPSRADPDPDRSGHRGDHRCELLPQRCLRLRDLEAGPSRDQAGVRRGPQTSPHRAGLGCRDRAPPGVLDGRRRQVGTRFGSRSASASSSRS